MCLLIFVLLIICVLAIAWASFWVIAAAVALKVFFWVALISVSGLILFFLYGLMINFLER